MTYDYKQCKGCLCKDCHNYKCIFRCKKKYRNCREVVVRCDNYKGGYSEQAEK